MELNKLNDVSIYMVPLCDSNITWQDLTVEAGYVNAYTTDKNRPYLEDKVFLVYKSNVNTKESLERFIKFSHLETVHTIRYVKINKKHYTIYCFSNPKYIKDIKYLRNMGKPLTTKASLDIYKFWNNVPVPDLDDRLFSSYYKLGDFIEAEIPEEDDWNVLNK